MLAVGCGCAVFALNGAVTISASSGQGVQSRQAAQASAEKPKEQTGFFDKIISFFRRIIDFFRRLFSITDNNDVPEEEQPPEVSKFADKKIDVLGDSITEQAKYIPLLESLTGASSIVNHGVSGMKLTQFPSQVGKLSEDADLLIVFGGTNDYWHHDTAVGSLNDRTSATFCGALNVLYDALTAKCPDAAILFVFPPHQTFGGNDDTHDFGYGTFDDFRAAMKTFCSGNGIKFFDLGTVDWDPAVYTVDGVHPNEAGGTKLANELYAFLQTNF